MADLTSQDEKHAPTAIGDAVPAHATTEPLHYDSSESDLVSPEPEKEFQPDATRTITQGTMTSALTIESQGLVSEGKRPWYRRLNPLKSQHKPPVPKERLVSKEYGAGFWSKLTFQWMASMMKVRVLLHQSKKRKIAAADDRIRRGINGRWN